MNSSLPVVRRRHSIKRYTLLTGATGLLGRYLMRDLLLKQERLAVLVRPTERQQARERIEQVLQHFETELGYRLARPVILTGDVCQPDLGLTTKQTRWVADYCSQVIHSAAILNFYGEDRQQEPWRTNLGGTQNVLRFAENAAIENFHYVSTAYVCGDHDGVVSENELAQPKSFRNDYERSKFEAETAVRNATGFTKKTIYRPAVIVGDSQTGYTSTYHGLFLYLRLLSMLVPLQQRNASGQIETPIELPIDGDEPRNLVPIDWVSKVISHLVLTPESHGRTYHLTPDKCSTVGELLEFCYGYFNSTGVKFVGADAEVSAETEFAQTFFDSAKIYSTYDTSDPEFCKANVKQFAGHLPCPEIDEAMVVRFLEFGKRNNWGKRRPKPVQVGRWIEAHLTEVALAAQKILSALNIDAEQPTFCLGLDVTGPGGGQWQLNRENGSFDVSPGLPSESHSILKLSDLQINSFLMHQGRGQKSTPTIDWSEPLETVISTNE